MTWEEAYSRLANRDQLVKGELICSAITRLGKPFDRVLAERAAPLVATYLDNENFLVRYQAMWFLGCWAKLRQYLSAIIRAARTDTEPDHRAFAVRCAGQILKTNPDPYAVKILLQMASSESEDIDVRAAAYGGLLYAFYGEDARARARQFEPSGTKSVEDFDNSWLSSLENWSEKLPNTGRQHPLYWSHSNSRTTP